MGADTERQGDTLSCEQAEAVRRELKRILQSPVFAASKRCRQVLSYIVEQTINGLDSGGLKERSIGTAVFDRPADYETGEDSIVRVSVTEVRKKLAQFYAQSGEQTEVVIQVPAGSYNAAFEWRGQPQVAGSELLVSAIDATPGSSSAGRPVRSAWLRFAALGIVGIVLFAAIALLWTENRALQRRLHGRSTGILGWMEPTSGSRLYIVTADAGVQLYKFLSGRPVLLSEYTDHRFLLPDRLPPEIPFDSQMARYLRNVRTSDTTTVHFATLLASRLPADRTYVRHPSEIGARDLQSDNAILLGGPFANPWVQLFERKLNFRIELGSSGSSVIQNVAPRAGEKKTYNFSAHDPQSRTVYARIALTHNTPGGGRVLLIAGPTAQATEAACMLVYDPRWADELARVTRLPYFSVGDTAEILVEVQSVGNNPSAVRIAASRSTRDLHP